MNAQDWVAVFGALIVSLFAPIAVRPVLSKLRIFDVPNSRSSHTQPVLRGAGVAPLLGVVVGLTFTLVINARADASMRLLIVLLASSAVSLVGLIEDLQGLRVAVRAGLQFLIGALATSFLVIVSDAAWWWVPVGMFAFACYTNAANFMDGINGISGLHGAAVGLALGIVGILTDVRWLVPAGLVVAASFLAFLPWNFMRGRVFLGDVGSYLLGGGIGIIVIAAGLDGVPIVALVAPLAIYLADTGTTLVRRALRGERWREAHRMHVYQRLTDSGLSHVKVSFIVTGASLITAALGLLSLSESIAGSAVAAFTIIVTVSLYLLLPHFRKVISPHRAPLVSMQDTPRSDLPTRVGVHNASRWAIIGGNGFIGSALSAELRAQGFAVADVPAPRLRISQSATADDALDQLACAQDALDSLAESLAGVDVVVNAAGLALPDSAADHALFGANGLLPLVILHAADRAQAGRVIHLSSAAVQGRREVLDETAATSPFSPYSRSKALGEAALLSYVVKVAGVQAPEVVIVRATSVQGEGRAATKQLRRLARSCMASVARPGDRPTVVSSLQGLVRFVIFVGAYKESVPTIVLQPWEGMTTSVVLEIAGGRVPLRVPASVCKVLVAVGYSIGAVVTPVNGLVRRVELMWLGQKQNAEWARSVGFEQKSYVAEALGDARERKS